MSQEEIKTEEVVISEEEKMVEEQIENTTPVEEIVVEKEVEDIAPVEKVEEKKELNFYTQVDWSEFTREEEYMLKAIAKDGHWQNLAAALHHLRPEQEYQIQLLIDIVQKQVGEPPMPESEVQKEMQEEKAKTGEDPIKTPEDEKKWQKKLDEEKKKHKEKVKKQKEEFLTSKGQEIEKRKRGRPKLS